MMMLLSVLAAAGPRSSRMMSNCTPADAPLPPSVCCRAHRCIGMTLPDRGSCDTAAALGRPVFFHHFWKTGGTNLNVLAHFNGERLYHHKTGYPLTGFPSNISPRCDVTFLEYPAALPPGLPAAWQPHWLFLVLLRDPMRAASLCELLAACPHPGRS